MRRCRNIHGVTLGLGLGPKGPALMVVVKLGPGPKGPALMVVVKYMVVIRVIASL